MNSAIHRSRPARLGGLAFPAASLRWLLLALVLVATLPLRLAQAQAWLLSPTDRMAYLQHYAPVIMQRAEEKPDTRVIVDLESQSVGIDGEEWTMHFDIDPFVKHMLINGLDDISLTLQSEDAIAAFESKRPSFLPTTVA